ncbi:MAG TPA: SDR family NAD(P)-dependent oxidoreductase [Gemmatimonadales bacterium]|nr:SDR family NAD(P)-dependent oxidoreductase [Gemmatimonadales bacterium]
MPSAAGRTILVTGATSGIGLETARALARTGGRVIVAVRDAVRGAAVVQQLVAAGGEAELLVADLASYTSVRQAAAKLLERHRALDVLVNNAGIVTRHRQVTGDGHERMWQTNFLGHVLLTRLLLGALRRGAAPRIVNVSSEAHRSGKIPWEDVELRRGFGPLRMYAQSKLAQVLYTRELARREPSIAVTALHPGAIWTGIWRPAPAPVRWLLRLVLGPADKGAAPVVRLAVATDVAGATGVYFNRWKEATPAPQGQDDAAAARLWDLAEHATA